MCVESSLDSEKMLCPHCDLVVELQAVPVGNRAVCPRCRTVLTSCQPEVKTKLLSYSFSALLMLLLSNLFPFINMEAGGITRQITLSQIPSVMVEEGYVSLAVIFVIFVQLIPMFCMLAIPFLFLQQSRFYRLNIWCAKVIFICKSWCMVEIFLAGVLVSFVKLIAYGEIGVGISFYTYCLFCLLQVRTLQYADRRWIWQLITSQPVINQPLQCGQAGIVQSVRSCHCCTAILAIEQHQCPRCFSYGHARKVNSLQWTLAILITSTILYIPANILPIMITDYLGNQLSSTIMSGVIFLWGEGSYPVALVIFIASIMVPSLKIAAILWLCWDAYRGNNTLKDRERMLFIYGIVEFVGRWSMIDIFVIAVLSALVRMGRLMSIYPDIGAVLFAAVVILTMFSAMAFDPRLLWDRINRIEVKESHHVS